MVSRNNNGVQYMWYYLPSCHNMQEKLVPARLQVTNTMSTDKELLCQCFLESNFIISL